MNAGESLMGKNLMGSHPEVTGTQMLFPEEPNLIRCFIAGDEPEDLAREFPKSCLPWALLAEKALENDRVIEGYAYARTGYHRGLDTLRSIGWRGSGTIAYDYQPNQGFLRALKALGRAAALIGEHEEVMRINDFLRDADDISA